MFVEEGLCVKQMGPHVVELSRERGMFLPPRWLQKDSFPEATTFLAAELSDQFMKLLQDVGPQSNEAILVPRFAISGSKITTPDRTLTT